jgi:tetratricopeptide (TPR) repeat protein
VRPITTTLILFAAALALYAPSWSNPFVLDDLTKIQENNDLKTPFRFENFVYPYSNHTMHFRNDPSRPLTYMTYWACWHLGGGSPEGFHALNTVAHAATASLVAALATKFAFALFAQSSWLVGLAAGLLFLSSPLLAGTALYAFGLSDILSAGLVLSVLLCLHGAGTRRRIAAGCALYVLALGAKQSAVVAFPLVVVTDYFMNHWTGNRIKTVYVPLAFLSAAFLLARWFYFGGIGDLEGQDQTLPVSIYAPMQGALIWKYLAQTLVPFGFAIDHVPLPKIPLWLGAASWLLIAAVTIAFFRAKAPAAKAAAWGWSVFLLCLLPVSSLIPTVDLYVERRAYLPAAGVFIALALLLWRVALARPAWRTAVAALAAGAITAQAAFARQRAQMYASAESLWREALSEDPRNPRALINLGVHYSAAGRWEESRQVLEDLLTLQPSNGAVYSKLGYIYQQKNYEHHDEEKALAYFQKSLQLDPTNIFAHYNLGVLLMERRDLDGAEHEFVEAARVAPQFARALLAAGQVALMNNKPERAAEHFRAALAIDPTLELARKYLAQPGVSN